MRHLLRPVIACVLLGAQAAASHAQTDDNLPSTPESAALVELLSDYEADRRAVRSFYSMSFDGRSYDRLGGVDADARRALEAIDFDALDQQGRIDYLLFRTELDARAAELDLQSQRLDEMRELIPFAETIAALERDRVAMKPIDAQAAAVLLDGIDEQIEDLRKRIDRGRKEGDAGDDRLVVSAVVANRASRTVRNIARTLNHWYGEYNGYKPGFGWWVSSPFADAHAALNDYAEFLGKTVAGVQGRDDDPLIGDPIGREKLLTDLKTEWIPYSPEELIAIADREFAWCEAEMLRASREMGFGDDWHAALDAVKQDHAAPGEQDTLVSELAQEAIDYVTDNDLVTVPPLVAELWRLEMIPPRDQRVYPFAFYGGNHMGVSYPTDEMGHEDKLMSMRGNNRHFTRAIVHHELVPGHHLQGFIAQRERSYRGTFRTPFLVEGWCLYWEMVLYDRGFPRTPQERIGMLFWRMHRCARIIVSLRFHLGEMSPEEMIEFLVDRVGHERSGATGEVRRFIGGDYSPLYQAAYMLGGLQLRALKAELVGTGQMTEREFHDTVLQHNSIPVELIRAGMTGQPLSRETVSGWRFGE
ncbi:MAG: DUF885 family protein [Phycisphaerales bacterium JB054]